MKQGREIVLLYFKAKKLRDFEFLLIFVLFEEYACGERSKEMNVHIDGKEIRRYLVI